MNVFQSIGEHLPRHNDRTVMGNRRVGAFTAGTALTLTFLAASNPEAVYDARTVCTPATASPSPSWNDAVRVQRELRANSAYVENVQEITQAMREIPEGVSRAEVCATDRSGVIGALVEVVAQKVSVRELAATDN
jgi:hypothetical protein